MYPSCHPSPLGCSALDMRDSQPEQSKRSPPLLTLGTRGRAEAVVSSEESLRRRQRSATDIREVHLFLPGLPPPFSQRGQDGRRIRSVAVSIRRGRIAA